MATEPMDGVARLTAFETARVAAFVLAPQIAQGMILRRPRIVRLAARLRADARAAEVLSSLRRRYGGRPLALRVPGRMIVIVTEPDDAEHVLAAGPEPFTPAAREKRAALAHFGPDVVLISSAAERAQRRPVNELALATEEPVHPCADAITAVAAAEVARLLDAQAEVTWPDWDRFWWRIARSIVLGPAGGDDTEITDQLRHLRRRANWAFAAPRARTERDALHRHLVHFARARERGGLFAHAAAHGTPIEGPSGLAAQAPHWLFAFDAAGIATFRALALVAARPGVAARARADDPFLRAVVEDSIRLYPTTLSILRETTEPTAWADRALPVGTLVVLPSSYLHRGPHRPDAHALNPDQWLAGDRPAGVVPFSAGPAVCAGRDLVLFTAAQTIATFLRAGEVSQVAGQSLARDPLPATLDHTALRLSLRPKKWLR